MPPNIVQQHTQTKKVLIGFALSLILLMGAVVWLVLSQSKPEGNIPSTEQREAAQQYIVSVQDQKAGTTVEVESISIAATANLWVAVAETDSEEITRVLGAARVVSGAGKIEINLLRATIPNTSYAVVLYRDDGDQIFDLYKDSVYIDFESGKRVVVPFKTLAE
ncbi:MAG: hypothetical protein WAV21_00610 [Minisyncoccia bacterium]